MKSTKPIKTKKVKKVPFEKTEKQKRHFKAFANKYTIKGRRDQSSVDAYAVRFDGMRL